MMAVAGDGFIEVGSGWTSYHCQPSMPHTSTFFDLRGERHVRLSICTPDGRDDKGSALTSGSYFYRLDTGDDRQTRRLTLIR